MISNYFDYLYLHTIHIEDRVTFTDALIRTSTCFGISHILNNNTLPPEKVGFFIQSVSIVDD